MYQFLINNRQELIDRCKAKVGQREKRAATAQQIVHGIPLFLDQLTRTLGAEKRDQVDEGVRISGPSGGDALALSVMGVSATAHGKELLELGYSVDQVVHDYGDLCQAITDLAFERDAPFAVTEFRTLNRCLDNAIADAVTEFSLQRDSKMASQQDADMNHRLGALAHELRNALTTAKLSVRALEVGNMSMGGATGAVLKRSHLAMTNLIERSLSEVKGAGIRAAQTLSVATFIADAEAAAKLYAEAAQCAFTVLPVAPELGIKVNRDLMLAAVANLIQNAFKFTQPGTAITLKAHAFGNSVLIKVADHCGGLSPETVAAMFKPFAQHGRDRTGLGLGLSIARRNVEADLGTLTVQNAPSIGCIFTISLPLFRI